MATISASLRMFDQMTRPLQQVTQALNLTISAMDNMNNSANRDIRITNSLNTARGAIQRASVGLQELASSQDRARNNQDRINNSFNKGKNVADGLLTKVKGLASAYLGFQAIKKGIDLTIVGAANLEQQLITISGMLGNKDVGKAFFEKINDYALISQYGLKNFAAISRQFIQFTKNTDKLMELNKLAERLAFLDPTQGLEGAGFALKEILGGDGMSLKGRFGFGSGEIKQLKEATSMDDFIKKFDHMVSEKGGTQKAVEEAANAASSLWNNLMANISTSFAKAGNRALEVMKPALRALNEAFREGKFEPFFDSISSGLAIIGQGVLFVLNIISWIGGFVQENWSIIEPILIATALYFSTILIPILWDTITTILAMGVAWLMINWPILLIIGLIALFIYILTQCGVTAEQILGFIGGIFGVTFAFIHNHIAYLWNKFASFAEFIANLFIDPVYAVKKLFYDMATNILGRIANIAKALTDLINMIPGVKVNLHSGLDNLISKIPVPKSDKNVVKIPRMKQLDYENEFKYGYSKGAGVANGIGNMFSTPDLSNISKKANLDEWNKAQGPGKLASEADKDKKKHLKSIDDKIDISNEHLEMLRDLAEQESIQNFTTLSPTVQITTGDIKEEADINKIIDKIESYMENELVNSAEGVYA
ncbi:hypothetical protein DP145_06705 [Clostridium tetani]|uniref:hypothetical protein n=1 Tax=Clostridium tetani TaxID=1513 RepID=UPI00100BCB9E|nr:hypothetical protein [Clostridium tetani]RXI46263.1 hypothetical protein DP126_04910 [Clostridium tetani]RXM61813.1 hypothetical protein DP138_03135 [Clostridium tetani]RXM67569.1 hypothetical protein DP145_06705 [Clostridium tetani]